MNRREFVKGTVTSSVAASLAVAGYHTGHAAESGKIKFGQIGTKHAHASGKIGTARKFADLYEVVGVVEPDEQRWQAVRNSGTYKGVKRMTQEQLLNTPGLQVVAVETEVRGLLDVAEKCVAAGMHIHLDKPAGESLSHFKRILDDATRQGRVVQMGYMYRYNPAFQLAFRAKREGWLGHVFEVHTTMSKKVAADSRKRLADYGGGSMFELGCHIIDAVVSVLGKPDKVTPFNRKTFPKQDSLLDNCLAVFEYPDATATVRTALIEFDGGARRQFVVCGDKGTVDIKPLEPPKVVLALDAAHGDYKQGRHEAPLKPLGGRYDGDLIDLAKIIRDEKSSDFPPEHDLAVQEAVLRASGLPLG
jgi:predicted dehydrogenase